MCQSSAVRCRLMAQPLRRPIPVMIERRPSTAPPRRNQRRTTMQGTVDRVVADEGFGFIIGPNGEEYFFHRTALKGVDWEEIGPGVPVIFQSSVGEGDRPDEHLRAVDIVLAPDAVPAVDKEPLPPGKLAGGA